MADKPFTVSDLAELTGFSMRYWQRKAADGALPGASYIQLGERRTYRIDPAKFLPWWTRQQREIPCQKTSGSVAVSTGIGSQKKASRTKARWKLEAPESLKTALRASDDN